MFFNFLRFSSFDETDLIAGAVSFGASGTGVGAGTGAGVTGVTLC